MSTLAMGIIVCVLNSGPSRAAAPLSLDNTGELGSFSQYGGRTYQWDNARLPKSPIFLNTDSGLIWNRWTDPNGNYHAEQLTTVPARVVSPSGWSVRVFDFTDFTLPAGYVLATEGSLPCAMTTTGSATIGGQMHVYTNRGAGGVSSYGDAYGHPGQGPAPGLVGLGPGHENGDYDYCLQPGAGGGGMGGAGASGQTTYGYYRDYDDYEYHEQSLPGGSGGSWVAYWLFRGGSGGASGCARRWNYLAGYGGGAGGGAVWLDAGGNLTITSAAVIWADGDPGMDKYQNQFGGGGGGGSGGYIGLQAAGVLTNAGTLTARGREGTQYGGEGCTAAGGSGGGGMVYLDALAISNTGTINVAGGGGALPGWEGRISASVPIDSTGNIIGTVVPASATTFLPTDVAGLKLWLDGSDVNGDGSILSNGTSVATWIDKSGLGNNAGVAPVANQPTYLASTIGGRGGLSFAASEGDYLQTARTSNFNFTTATFFVVAQDNPGGPHISIAANTVVEELVLFDYTLYHHSGTNPYTIRRDSELTHQPAPAAGTYFIQTGIFGTSPSDLAQYINGAASAGPIVYHNDPWDYSVVDRLATIGWRDQWVEHFNGVIDEIIVYDSKLTSVQINAVQTYLSGKYGIAIPRSAADFNKDGYVDDHDWAGFEDCADGPALPYASGCTLAPDGDGKVAADFDKDGDVDEVDFATLQRCYSGTELASPDCTQ
jgi:hypothetical protein